MDKYLGKRLDGRYEMRELIGVDAAVLEANHDLELLKNGPYPFHLKKRILSDHGHLSNRLCGLLAGRLFDMTELMMECYDSPDEVKILLLKATEFIISYIKEFKKVYAPCEGRNDFSSLSCNKTLNIRCKLQ